MKKILLSFFIVLVLVFSTIPTNAFASEKSQTEGDKIETVAVENTEQPQQPIITPDMSNKEANQLIDQYNEEVDTYNENAKAQNAVKEKEYQEEVQKVEQHNQEEEQKVEQNKQDLEKQEKLEQRVAADSQSKVADQTKDFNDLPNSWIENTTEPKTIKVEKVESTEQYKVTNLHLYINGDLSNYNCVNITDSNFFVDSILQNQLILGEWETITVGNNDIITIYSEGALYPHSGAMFSRKLSGYTNGYWVPYEEFFSTAVNVMDSWGENGPETIFSYNDGTTDRQSIKNILNLYIYTFMRYGVEPEKVQVYTPDFWKLPPDIKYIKPLNRMERLKEEEIKPEPKPEEDKKDNIESKKEEIKEKVKKIKDNKTEENKTEKIPTVNTEIERLPVTNDAVSLFMQWGLILNAVLFVINVLLLVLYFRTK